MPNRILLALAVFAPNHALQRTAAGSRLQAARLVAAVAELGSLNGGKML